MASRKVKVLATTLFTAIGCFAAANASAVTVSWTDWTAIGLTSATGSMGGVTVSLSSVGNMDGPSQIACGINYWTQPNPADPAYTGGTVSNAPTACEQVALNSPATITATFSSPLSSLYMALLSVGQPNLPVTYAFDRPFGVDSDGVGYWSFANAGLPGPFTSVGNTITMNEFHGVLSFGGPVSSLTFSTRPSEYWHAFTFGSARPVPEPGTLALLGLGLMGLMGLTVSRRRARN